jgi:hypothetical protein
MERKMICSKIMSQWRCEENGVEIENRRKFEIEHNIKKLISGRNRFANFIWYTKCLGTNLHGTLHLDHEEWYETKDGYIIWISTPYSNEDEEYLQNTIFGVPFQKTECLYNNGYSYFKNFRKNIQLNTKSCKDWNWKGKNPEPKCACGNELFDVKYNIELNMWKSQLNPKYVWRTAKQQITKDICAKCLFSPQDISHI